MSQLKEFSIFEWKSEQATAPTGTQAIQPARAEMIDGVVPADLCPSPAGALTEVSSSQNVKRDHKKAVNEAPEPVPAIGCAETINIERLAPEKLETLFPMETRERKTAAPAPERNATVEAKDFVSPAKSAAGATHVHCERRAKHRALISTPVRVRSIDLTHDGDDDITTTLNVSRLGILLSSTSPAYYNSMDVMVTFPYSKAPNAIQMEQPGRVIRVSELPDGRRSVAIALGVIHRDDEFILSSGKKIHPEPEAPKIQIGRDPNSLKPLVLALDAEASARESLKNYLVSEGYDVITVSNAKEARDVLNRCTPSLLIAEIEGEGMPGYDICAHCKSTPRLQSVPVMLTTGSGFPSDYAKAHSLGAVVCMAKPYRQERLGHVVRLLAPPPNVNDSSAPPRLADPSRRHLGNSNLKKSPPSNENRRLRFTAKS